MLIATESAVYTLGTSSGGERPEPSFEGTGIRRVAEERNGAVVAFSDGTVRLPAEGGGRTVAIDGEQTLHSLLILNEDPREVLVGTEPPHIYRLTGTEAERLKAFDDLECRDGWHTPWGGSPAVRSMGRTGDGWVYADIHVGSIMRSSDRGGSWEPVTPELHKDVHQVATCPATDERVYAQTARAFYISEDRGRSWIHRAEDLGERYGRAVAVHPTDPDLVLCTVSDGPHGENVHGELYRSEDAGRHWTHVAEGFPESTPENIDTFHVAFAPDGSAWALVGNTLYAGGDRATDWRAFWQAPADIIMLASARPDGGA
ncbi:MAG: hypothetical protein PVJ27_08160 [Candidatus Brocadiaceae bacterium]|jgi:hypothetical protein